MDENFYENAIEGRRSGTRTKVREPWMRDQ